MQLITVETLRGSAVYDWTLWEYLQFMTGHRERICSLWLNTVIVSAVCLNILRGFAVLWLNILRVSAFYEWTPWEYLQFAWTFWEDLQFYDWIPWEYLQFMTGHPERICSLWLDTLRVSAVCLNTLTGSAVYDWTSLDYLQFMTGYAERICSLWLNTLSICSLWLNILRGSAILWLDTLKAPTALRHHCMKMSHFWVKCFYISILLLVWYNCPLKYYNSVNSNSPVWLITFRNIQLFLQVCCVGVVHSSSMW